MDEQVCPAAQPKAGKPLRGQNLMEWYEALISAALVLVLVFSFFFRMELGCLLYSSSAERD